MQASAIQNISLTATPSMQNGQVTWTLCDTNGKCGNGSGTYPSVDLGQNTPAATITITINDPSNLGIVFAPGQNAMWIQPTTAGCPQSYVWNSQGQIGALTRVSNTQISISDANTNAGMLSLTYRLNFVNGQNQSVASIDPVIKNGGKGLIHPPSPNTLLIESALIALVVAFIVSFIVARIVASRVARQGP
jgi:hypothetical protein